MAIKNIFHPTIPTLPTHPTIPTLFLMVLGSILFIFSLSSPVRGQDSSPVSVSEGDITLTADTNSFSPDNPPLFTITESPSGFTSFTRSITNLFGPDYSLDQTISASISQNTQDAETTPLSPPTLLTPTSPTSLTVSLETEHLTPGEYTLTITKDGETIEQTFAYGVLAVNTNKSEYKKGEEAYIQMAALDSRGDTLCNARLQLDIFTPTHPTDPTLLTPTLSDTCGANNVTDDPDYFSFYTFDETGDYVFRLTNTGNGYDMVKTISVVESTPISVERLGATRINPFKSKYTMLIAVTSDQTVSTTLKEVVPENFSITPSDEFQVVTNNNKQEIVWNLDLTAGEEQILAYEYQAPQVSPELYLLGPISIFSPLSPPTPLFIEKSTWHIASDAGEWSFVAHRGAANNKTSGTTITVNPSATIAVGRVAVVRAVSDNDSSATSNGQTTRHTVTDAQTNSWTKIREHTFGGGSAGAGVTVSLWASQLTTAIGTGDAITLTLGSSVDAKAIAVDEFQLASGFSFTLAGAAGDQGTGTAASVTLSSLASTEYLFLGTVGVEGPSTDGFTQDTDYTTLTESGTTGGEIASNVTVRGGRRITTATGDTYNPTLSSSGTVSFVNATSAAATSVAAVTGQATGDLLLVFAYRSNNITPPTAPAGWNTISSSGGDANSSIIAWKNAASGSEGSGTWTNATHVVMQVYRGHNATTPIGGYTEGSSAGSASRDIVYPAVTMSTTNGSSWVAGIAGRATGNSNLSTAPTGMTNRTSAPATPLVTGHDTAGGVSEWSEQTVSWTGGATAHYRVWTIEIQAGAVNRDWSAVVGALRARQLISIEGTCKQYDQTTNCANDRTVRVAVNGTLQAETGTTASGTWTISNVEVNAANDIVTVFIDGVDAANRANAVTKYGGTGNITDVALYEEHVTIGSNQNNSVSNANMASYDYSASGNDTDILFDVDGSNNLIVDVNSVSSQEKLLILASNTLAPGANVTTNKLEIAGTYTGASETLTIQGTGAGTSRPFYINGGTFTPTSNTVDFEGAGATDIQNTTYNALTFTPTSGSPTYTLGTTTSQTITTNGAFTVGDGTNAVIVTAETYDPTLTVTGNFTINGSATFTASSTGTFTIAGNYDNDGVFNSGTGAVTFTATSGTKTIDADGTGAEAFHDIIFNGSGGTFQLTTALDVDNDLTITAGTLDANSNNITVGGSWANSDIFSSGTGSVTFDGAATATLNSGCATAGSCTDQEFYTLIIDKTSAENTVTLTGTALTTQNSLTITRGTFVQSTLNVYAAGTTAVSIAANGTWLNRSTGNLTLGGTFSNDGSAIFQGNGESCGLANDITITSTTTDPRNWEGSGTFEINDVTISYMTSTPAITALSSTEGTDVGANWTVSGGCVMTVTGYVYEKGTTTPSSACGVYNIALKAPSSTKQTTTCSNIDGSYTFSDIVSPEVGDGLVVWIDSEGNEKGSLVVHYGGGALSSDNILYEDALSITSGNTDPVTIDQLNTYDSSDDSDIVFATSNDPDTITVASGIDLIVYLKSGVAAGSTVFEPMGVVTTQGGGHLYVYDDAVAILNTTDNVIAGDVFVQNGAVLRLNGNTTISGGDITLTGTGSVTTTAGTPTITLVGAGTIGGGTGTLTFHNLTLTGTGATTINAPLTVNNDLTVGDGTNARTLTNAVNDKTMDIDGTVAISANGTLTASSTAAFTVGGSWTNDGTFTSGTGTVTFNESGNVTLDSGCATAGSCTNQDFHTLVIDKASAGTTVTLSSTHLTTQNSLTITTGTLVQGALNIHAAGAGVSVGASGTWSNTSTGDIALAGGVSNSGSVLLGGTCGETDAIAITAISGTPSWSGAGIYTLQDVSLTGQTTALSITVYSGTNGGGNTGFTFDPNCPMSPVSITVAAWVNPTTSIATKAIAVKQSEFILATDASGNPICSTTGSETYSVTSASALSLSSWQHVACAYDYTNAKLRIFVNGAQTGIKESASGGINDEDTTWQVGRDAGGTYGDFQGTIDEVRLYNRSLSPREVEQLYNWSPGSAGHWKLDENTGVTAYDISGNNNTGTLTNSPIWVPGKYGSAVQFDGTNDYISVADSPTLNPQNSLTVSTWVKMSETFDSTADHIQGVVDKGAYQIFMDKRDGKAKFVVNDAAADAFSDLGNGFNADVNALTVWNGDLYAGGDFRSAGTGGTCTDCNYIAKWDGVSWSTVGNGFNNWVWVLTVWNGDLYAGGDFTGPGSGGTCTDCNYIAKWDGVSWSSVGNGFSSTVRGLTVWNGDLYAGGFFTSAGTCTTGCSRIAKWNGSSWSTVGNGFNNSVYALTVWNGDLYAGGIFTSAGSGGTCTDCNRIAKWDGVSWSTVGNGFNSGVNKLTVWNGDLYAGGGFRSAGSGGTCTDCNRIAKWDGVSWSTVGNGFNSDVYALTVWNGDLYVGGFFTSAGSGGTCTDCNRIAKWDGVSWSSVGNGFSSTVRALTVWNGDLYVGGSFRSAGSGGTWCTDCNRIAKWGTSNTKSISSATTSWTAGSWYHLAGVYDGSNLKMYVNGSLETTSATSMTRIEDTLHDLLIGKTFGSQMAGSSGEHFKGAIDDIRMYPFARTSAGITQDYNAGHPGPGSPAGSPKAYWKFDEGYGTTFNDSSAFANNGSLGTGSSAPTWSNNGKYAKALAFDGINDVASVPDSFSLSPTSELSIEGWVKLDETFDSTADHIQGVVDKGGYQIFMDKSDGKAKFVVNDAAADAFATMGNGFNNAVEAFTVWNGDLYAGGSFRSAGSGGTCTDCNRIAKWDGVSWSTVGNGFNAIVYTLTVWNGDLYAGGTFTSAGSGGTCTDCNRIAKWNGSSWSTVGNGFNGTVTALTVWNGDLYAVGIFTSAGSGGTCADCNRIAKWDGVSWSTVGNGFNSDVLALTVWNGDLYAGGSFRSAGSGGTCTDCNRIAKWDGVSWSTVGNGFNHIVSALTVWNGDLYAGGTFTGPGSGGTCTGCNRIAKWNGSSWSTVGNGFSSTVYALTVWNGDLYAGGSFTSAGSGGTCTDCNRIAKWDGVSWSTVGNGFNGTVEALTVWNGDLYAGGEFRSAGSGGTCTDCNYIAKWGTTNTTSAASSTTSWTAGNWYHLAGVFDGSNLKMYVNGIEEGSVTTSMTGIEDTSHALRFGATYGSQITGGNGEYLKGSLDEFKIYSGTLNSDQVKVAYNAGKAISFGSLGTGVGGTGPDNSATRAYCPPGDTTAICGPLAEWKFDENTGTTARDTSANDNTGTLFNTPIWVPGRIGQALSFDGVNDYVSVPDSSSLHSPNSLTIETWVKMDSTFNKNSPNIQGVVDKGGYQIFMDKSDGKAKFVVNDAANDAFSTLGTGMSSSVYSLAVWNGDLYIGGSFSSAGGVLVNSIAKWDGNSWSALSTGVWHSVTAYVDSLIVWNGDLYAGGRFTSAGTCTTGCVSIAKWDGSTWSALSTGVWHASSIQVNALTIWNGNLIAVGNFDTAGACTSTCIDIASWNGSSWSGFGTQTSSSVKNSAVVWNGDLYVGGGFTSLGGDPDANRIAKWDGSSWSWPTGQGTPGIIAANTIYAFTVWNGKLIAAGTFTTIGSCTTGCNRIAMWDGSTWSALGTGMNNSVYSLAVWNGDLYAGGSFTSAESGGTCTDCNRIAKWDGVSWSTVGNGFNNSVWALTVWNGDLYAGGLFTSAGSGGTCTGCNRIAKWGTTNTKSIASATTSWTAGNWYHLAGVFDGNNLKMYVNGSLETTSATSMTAIEDTTHDLYIGKTHGSQMAGGNDETLAGTIDDVRIFGYGRAPAQMAWGTNRGKPTAWYKLDEGVGTTGNNSGNLGIGISAAMGADTAAPTWTTSGKRNGALTFDGGDYLQITDTSSLRFDGATQDFSLFSWIKRSTTGAAHYILSKEDADNDGWRLLVNANNTVTCSVNAIDITSTVTIDTNWHHVGCTIDRDGTGQVYIDGVPSGTAVAISSEVMATTANPRIGTRAYSSTDYFNGQIDDVRIYNYKLTIDQIRILMNEGAASFR